MKKTTGKRWLWILIGAGMICLCLLSIGLGLAWWANKNKPAADRPLVWLTTPTTHQVFEEGQAIPIQALVRSSKPVTRLELWIDSKFIKDVRVESGQTVPATGLTHTWSDPSVGVHSLVARAFTADGTQGVASVRVDVLAQDPEESIHVVAEGEDDRIHCRPGWPGPRRSGHRQPGCGRGWTDCRRGTGCFRRRFFRPGRTGRGIRARPGA